MTWDSTMRRVALVCFCLMWIPFLFFFLRLSWQPMVFDMTPLVLFFILLAVFVILFIASFFAPLVAGFVSDREIRAKGTGVPAVIRQISDTGIFINNVPVLEIVLLVQPPHEPAFEATIRKVIPFSSLAMMVPGARLEVLYIPGTNRVALA